MQLSLALLQTTLAWEDPPANREHFDRLIRSVGEKVDLLVLPEMFSSGFTMEPGRLDIAEARRTLEWMQDHAKARDAALAGSLAWPLENGNFVNRLFFARPDGTCQHYDKRHTFTLAGEHEVYQRGRHKEIWEFRGFRLCPQVCYDLRFPVFSRNTENYDLLFYVANWPDARIAAWDTLLKARAIENMAFCVGVNRIGDDPNGLHYTGHSAAYDPMGRALAFSDREEVLRVDLDRKVLTDAREKLRFLQDRDTFTPGW